METTVKVNGVNCIKGEIHSILTLMRVNSTWSKHNNNINDNNEENMFVTTFRQLNQYLEGIYDVGQVDCLLYITPFHLIITSDQANGPLTCAALGSLVKFISYGLMTSSYPRCKEAMKLLCQCVSACIFEETDWESDEVILMKLLELSTLLYRCNASILLSISDAWDIYSTCIAIHSQYRASKILRSEAETALRNITLSAFSRAQSTNFSYNSDFENVDDSNDYKSWDLASKNYCFDGIIGITLLLGKVMIVLSGLMDLQKNTIQYVSFSLTLVNIALEAGGSSLSFIPTLVDILRGDVCRHLLIASQSDDLGIFSLSLRVIFNLFISIKDHMKIQLEVFLISIHLRLLSNNQSAASLNQSTNLAPNMNLSLAREELVLESLLEFCREPLLMQDLYTNYDCDVQCTNLFDNIISTLCQKSLPNRIKLKNNISNVNTNDRLDNILDIDNLSQYEIRSLTSNILNKIAIDGVLSVVHAISLRCISYRKVIHLSSSNDISDKIERSEVNEKVGNLEAINNNIYVTPLKSSANVAKSPKNYNISPEILQSKSLIYNDGSLSPIKDITVRNRGVSNSSSYSSSDNEEVNLNPLVKTTDEEIDEDDTDFVLLARARTAEVLRQRKLKKQRLRLAAEKFNLHPLKVEWLRYALEQGLVTYALNPNSIIKSTGKGGYNDTFYQSDPKSVAKFLRNTPGLGKTQIGEFISKGPADLYPFHAMVLREYVHTFDFSGKHSAFHKALRLFLGHFRLPGEAQCIDRIMEAFAGKLFQQLGQGRPFKSADSVFILAFSTIMLNTDLHNPQIPMNKKMTKEQFVKNNRGINDGEDLPREYLENLYDEIKTKQIQVDVDISDNQPLNLVIDYTDSVSWNKLINSRHTLHAPAAFTSTETAREEAKNHSLKLLSTEKITQILSILHEKDMFLVIIHQVVEVILTTWIYTTDDQIIRKIFEGFVDIVNICNVLELYDLLDSFIIILTSRSLQLLQSIHQSKLKHVTTPSNQSMKSPTKQLSSWDDLYDISSQIENEKKIENHSHTNITIPSTMKDNLEKLLTNTIDLLISDYFTYLSIDKWKHCHLIKYELLLKLSIYLSINYISILSNRTWITIFQILLYARSRGALPPPLVTINISYDYINENSIYLPYSKYATNCYTTSSIGINYTNNPIFSMKLNNKLNKSINIVNKSNQTNSISQPNTSIWQSIGGLLGINSTKPMNQLENISKSNNSIISNLNNDILTIENYMKSYKFNPLIDVFDGNTCPYNKQSNDNDEMLRLVLLTCRIDQFLLTSLKDCNNNINDMIFDIIIKILYEMIDYVLAISISNTQSQPQSKDNNKSIDIPIDDNIEKENKYSYLNQSGCIEMNMIIILEWLINIYLSNVNISNNIMKLTTLWNKIYSGLFINVLEKNIDIISLKCPYFIERCLYNIININNKLINDTSINIDHNIDVQINEIIWMNFHILKYIPIHIIENISNHFGAGLLSFLRSKKGLESINNIERWYMFCNLLTISSCNDIGQIFVWECIMYLIDNNYISINNFSPLRYLILRYLHGTFPTSDFDNDSTQLSLISSPIKSNLSNNNNQINYKSNYTSYALLALLKLTMNAIICYINNSDLDDIQSISLSDWRFIIDSDMNNINHITYYQCKLDIINYTNHTANSYLPNMITIKPIKFPIDNVIDLFLDTMNIYCDYTNINYSIIIIKRSLYCIQNLFDIIHPITYQSNQLTLSSLININNWNNIISNLLNNLPNLLLNFYPNYNIQLNNQIISITNIDICIYSNNIIYNYIITYYNIINKSNTFNINWIKFISILSNNFIFIYKILHNSINNNNLNNYENFLNEMIEMLIALLRLLLPTNKSDNKIDNKKINQIENKRVNIPDNTKTGLFGYVGSIFGYTQPKNIIEENIIIEKFDDNINDISIDEIEKIKLLYNTWKDINIICNNNIFIQYLSNKEPQIYLEIMKTIELYNRIDKYKIEQMNIINDNQINHNEMNIENKKMNTIGNNLTPIKNNKINDKIMLSNQKSKNDKPFLV